MKKWLLLTVMMMVIFVPSVALASDGSAPDWTQIIIAAVSLMFTAVIVPLVKAGFEWLKGKTHNEALLTAITEAQTVADNVVAQLQQSVVGDLKAKSADGKLSIDDVKQIAQTAYQLFINDLSAGSLEVIESNAESLKEYVGNLIEARLLKLKSAG